MGRSATVRAALRLVLGVAVAIALLGAGQLRAAAGLTPVVDGVDINPNPAALCETVTFNADVTCDDPVTYDWRFPDEYVDHNDRSKSGNPVTITFAETGTVTVRLTVTNQAHPTYKTVTTRNVDVIAARISIDSGPTATPQNTTVCSPTVTLSVSASVVCGSGSLTYDWDYGDGTIPHGTGATVTHTYGQGTWQPTVTISSGDLPVAAGQTTVAVNAPDAPTAAPTNVTATVTGPSSVDVSWGPASGADSYNVYRGTTGGSYTLLGNTTSTSYQDANIQTGSCYKVAGVHTCNDVPSAEGPTSVGCTAPGVLECYGSLSDFGPATANPTPAVVGQSVQFGVPDNRQCKEAQPVYSWTFGDGGVASTPSPTHTYLQGGEYTAQVEVSYDGSDGRTRYAR